jgi:hypothetical protein
LATAIPYALVMVSMKCWSTSEPSSRARPIVPAPALVQ